MTGEPTVPVPISDLLAALIDEWAGFDFTPQADPYNPHDLAWPVLGLTEAKRDLIVRGVRDLAARVETLEQALRFYADPASWDKSIRDHRTGYVYSKLSTDGGAVARVALAGQSTTETPS